MTKTQQLARVHTRSIDDPLAAAIAPPPDETPEQRETRLAQEAEAKRISDDIDERIREERALWKKKKGLFKLLLLGQSESGKSTVLKNFQLNFAPQAWQEERISWRAVIQLNLVRSVNLILDALAEELAASNSSPSPIRPPSAGRPDPNSADSSPTATEPSPTSTSAPPAPLAFTSKHALLKLRLGPLRQVEADLKQRLGAASSETDPEPHSARSPSPYGASDAPFESTYAHARNVRSQDLCLRSGRSLRDALFAPQQEGGRIRAASPVMGRTGLDDVTEIVAGCGEDVRALWEDEVVREMLKRRKMQMEESGGYFLDDVERIATRTYEPSDDDVVRARLRTLGVQEYSLNFENTGEYPGVDRSISKEWIIYDVGGSRTSRAAWLPYFEDANAILFLAPISCFDETLAEDKRVNRLEDSFILWKSIVSSKLLAKCIIILFLNKYDLLSKKLRAGVRINKYLSSYGDRENTAPVLAKYLHHKFRDQHKDFSPEPRSFYGYVTSVVDTKATSSTLASVRDALVQKHLHKADFV
ncbi:G-alpha-domain-containing protein [Laetiporus sulphureus 93-53]|uniref:G-alpha-domain-containing protein n=1 Tax=Laetiporus sulphureus 93-53 TaxID=1314785 RepID=A0A165EVH4_9APHY|nr:G-alpha-domain-containing protein [Laetiporus sulphureus 93-53]KZT07849.1 G-alpha-domain-containing protein [Laetiporus sulphureus 93-53]